MNKLAALLAPLVLGFAIAAPAAVTYASLGAAGNSNAFIFGNATTNSGGHADGAVVVGGDWTGSEYEARKSGSAPNLNLTLNNKTTATNTAVYIGGVDKISGNNGLRTFGGDVYLEDGKGKSTYKVDTQNKGKVYTGLTSDQSFDLAPTLANLKKLSSDLFKLGGDTIKYANNERNNVKVNLSLNSATKSDLKVYTVDSSLLGFNSTLDFSGVKGTETVVINVTGHTVDWGWQTNGIDASKILWNFVDAPKKGDTSAQTLSVNRSFNGTILAPTANVTQKQNITGTLIANNWTVSQNTSLISKTFTGKIPLVSAPEPAGVMTMAGFLGLALFSRRRQAVRL